MFGFPKRDNRCQRTQPTSLLVALVVALLAGPVTAFHWQVHAAEVQQDTSTQSRSVWEGVYTQEQAKRGEVNYIQECASCHGTTLAGGESAPALIGDEFLGHWYGETVGDLHDRIRLTMPADSPGKLSRQLSADIVAYLLSVNDFPAGSRVLENETVPLKQIRLEVKPKR